MAQRQVFNISEIGAPKLAKNNKQYKPVTTTSGTNFNIFEDNPVYNQIQVGNMIQCEVTVVNRNGKNYTNVKNVQLMSQQTTTTPGQPIYSQQQNTAPPVQYQQIPPAPVQSTGLDQEILNVLRRMEQLLLTIANLSNKDGEISRLNQLLIAERKAKGTWQQKYDKLKQEIADQQDIQFYQDNIEDLNDPQ